MNTYYENTNELISYFTNLAKSTGQEENTPYELVPCIIKQPSMSEDCQSSFFRVYHNRKKKSLLRRERKLIRKNRKKTYNTSTHYDSDSQSDPHEDLVPLIKLRKQKKT